MDTKIEEYLLGRIRNIYMTFDRCHDHRHFDEVYTASEKMVNLPVHEDKLNELISLTAAAYHDTGRMINDSNHEKYSAIIFSRDLLYKKIVSETYGKELYDGICDRICDVIKTHRSSAETTDELGLILKDADKSSFINKNRCLYRLASYYIDRIWDGHSYSEMTEECYKKLFVNGSVQFLARSRPGKILYGENIHTVNVSFDELRNALESIMRE